MRSYGRVAVAFWTDEKVQALSERGKLLALYLLTGPHSNAIGCYRLPWGYIAADLAWDQETVTQTVSELVSMGFVKRCSKTALTLIPRYLRYNPIDNPNVGKRLKVDIEALPRDSEVFQDLIDCLEPFDNRLPNGFINRMRNGSGKGMPNHSPAQHQPNPAQPSDPGTVRSQGEAQAALRSDREDPATDLIRAFDEALVDVWGEERKRGWPKADDLVYARRWREAGIDRTMAMTMFREGQAAKLKGNGSPITSLKWFDDRVTALLNAKPNGHLRKIASPDKIAAARARADAAATARLDGDAKTPSEAMVEAGARRLESTTGPRGDARDTWTTMINAILSESGK